MAVGERRPKGLDKKTNQMRVGHDLSYAAWKSMVSAVTPGPKDMAQPCWPDCALARTCWRTNMTVAEDMLPKRARMSREKRMASGGSSRPCSTASRMVLPPGWTAHRSKE